jgi:hypothetical protein
VRRAAALDTSGGIAMTGVVRNLVYAQLSFFGFLAVCFLISGEGFESNHGLSYYGEHRGTFVPYGLGFVLCSVFLLRAAAQVPGTAVGRRLAVALRVLVVLLLLDLLTPDTIDSYFYWAHVIVSALLFLFELGLAAWLVGIGCRSRPVVTLLAVQFGAGLIAMFSQLHVIAFLSVGILLFQVSFALLLVRAAMELELEFRRAQVAENLA